jgi:hypothetical protein
MFQKAVAALGAARGRLLSNQETAALLGRGKTTISYWLNDYENDHLQVFVCLLEQLSPADRTRLFTELCRELPLLDHPRIRHDPAVVSELSRLLRERSGLTLLTGGTDAQRTFLLTALGHTLSRSDFLDGNAGGIDVHVPHWFVPLEYIRYARPSPGAVKSMAAELTELVRSEKSYVLLNNICEWIPASANDLLKLSQTAHVILADDLKKLYKVWPKLPERAQRRIVISSAGLSSELLRIEVQQ